MIEIPFDKEMLDALIALTPEDAAEALRMVRAYAYEDEEPETKTGAAFSFFSLNRKAIDVRKSRSKAGRVGGKTKKQTQANGNQIEANANQNEANGNQTQANTNQTQANGNQIETERKEKENEKKEESEKKERTKERKDKEEIKEKEKEKKDIYTRASARLSGEAGRPAETETEDAEEPPERYDYASVIKYLNEKTGRNFTTKNEEAKRHIRARYNEGHTLDDFKRVIDNMTARWKDDPRMCDYLRPATLFGNKFEGYLNASPTPPARGPTKFGQIETHGYDYDALERALMGL